MSDTSSQLVANRQRLVLLTSATFAAVLAVVLTSRPWLAMLNWDNGAYVADLAMGRDEFLVHPWSAHFAIGYLYAAGADLVRPFGGTVFDGLRLTTTVVFALSAMVVADVIYRLTRNAVFTAALMLVWCTSWEHAFLLLTIEDNLLYLPCLALLFRTALLRQQAFRDRDAVLVGAIAGFAILLSLQTLLYIGPACAIAVLATPVRSGTFVRTRARALVLVAAGVVGAALAWCLLISIGPAAFFDLLRRLTARPDPPLAMRSLADLGGALEALGAAAGYLVGHVGMGAPPTFGLSKIGLGVAFLLLVLGTCLPALAVAWRRRESAAAIPLSVVALTTLAFTLATPLRLDVEYAYLKRVDFFPTCLCVGIAAALAIRSRPLGRTWMWLLACLLVTTFQVRAARAWSISRHGEYATLPCPAPVKHDARVWYGRDRQSWVTWFRGVRDASPDACVQVLDFDEVSEGRWWLEVPGALWSELPDHVVIGPAHAAADWRYPPRMADIADKSPDAPWRRSCAVLSCSARQRLQRAGALPR